MPKLLKDLPANIATLLDTLRHKFDPNRELSDRVWDLDSNYTDLLFRYCQWDSISRPGAPLEMVAQYFNLSYEGGPRITPFLEELLTFANGKNLAHVYTDGADDGGECVSFTLFYINPERMAMLPAALEEAAVALSKQTADELQVTITNLYSDKI